MIKDAQLQTVVPLNYGAMPDLGRYSQPDGPAPELVAAAAARQDRRGARRAGGGHRPPRARHARGRRDDDRRRRRRPRLRHRRRGRRRRPAGDAARRAPEIRDRWPDIGVEIGQAAELVLGMHGELEYDGRRLAGMWPLEQLRAVTAAGATIFGPAVNVNTTKSLAWNTARACALVKPVTAEATIPVHMNAGMGVGGVPMSPYPPVDATSRASRALVDILQAGRVVGRCGGPLGDGLHTRARLGDGRDADCRRSGGPHADHPRHAPSAGQAVRRRQARLFGARPQRHHRHARPAPRLRPRPHPGAGPDLPGRAGRHRGQVPHRRDARHPGQLAWSASSVTRRHAPRDGGRDPEETHRRSSTSAGPSRCCRSARTSR